MPVHSQPPSVPHPLDHVPLADRIESELEQMIVQGDLAVGARLPGERVLMQSLGVSRPVVREAISRLRSRGLLRIYPSKGTFVTGTPEWGVDAQWQSWLVGDRERALAMSEVADALNERAAELAARRATEADLAELRLAHACFEQQCERRNIADVIHWDKVFHYRIAVCAGNPVLVSFVKQIHDAMKATHRSTLADESTMQRSLNEHSEILAAIEARDPERAARGAVAHAASARAEIVRETSADAQRAGATGGAEPTAPS